MSEEEIVDFIDNMIAKKLSETLIPVEPNLSNDKVINLIDRLEIKLLRRPSDTGFDVVVMDKITGYNRVFYS